MRTEKADVSRKDKKQNGQGDARRDNQRKARAGKASAGWKKAEKERPAEEWREGPESLEEPEEFFEGGEELFEEPEELSGASEAADEPENFSEGPEGAADELEDLFELEDLEEPDLQEDGEEPEEWSGEEEWEEEEEPLKLWKAVGVFLGLIALAAVVCAVLWHFSHSEDPEDAGMSTQGQISGSASQPASGSEASDSESTDEAGGSEASDQTIREPISGTKDMEFVAVQHSVTPKDVINLRSVPDTSDTTNIVTQIQNGEVLSRTGINEETGWSKIEYEGRTLYGVSQFLTTDLDYKTPIETSGPNRVSTKDGRVIIFADCDDWISPKEYVNLRTEPSTTEGNSTVSCQLNYGEKVHRTGFSPDAGWSRIEYNDQVLYVVTSLMIVEEE